jgi:hypothetical protein
MDSIGRRYTRTTPIPLASNVGSVSNLHRRRQQEKQQQQHQPHRQDFPTGRPGPAAAWSTGNASSGRARSRTTTACHRAMDACCSKMDNSMKASVAMDIDMAGVGMCGRTDRFLPVCGRMIVAFAARTRGRTDALAPGRGSRDICTVGWPFRGPTVPCMTARCWRGNNTGGVHKCGWTDGPTLVNTDTVGSTVWAP